MLVDPSACSRDADLAEHVGFAGWLQLFLLIAEGISKIWAHDNAEGHLPPERFAGLAYQHTRIALEGLLVFMVQPGTSFHLNENLEPSLPLRKHTHLYGVPLHVKTVSEKGGKEYGMVPWKLVIELCERLIAEDVSLLSVRFAEVSPETRTVPVGALAPEKVTESAEVRLRLITTALR